MLKCCFFFSFSFKSFVVIIHKKTVYTFEYIIKTLQNKTTTKIQDFHLFRQKQDDLNNCTLAYKEKQSFSHNAKYRKLLQTRR